MIHGYLVCTWYDSSSVLLRSINKTCTTPQPICVPYLVPGSLYTLILIIRTHSSLEGAAAAAAAAAAATGTKLARWTKTYQYWYVPVQHTVRDGETLGTEKNTNAAADSG